MEHRRSLKFLPVILVVFSAVLFAALCLILHARPDRLIGAAFCHQIGSRSPESGFPFCYRCSGLFCGIFWGLLYAVFRRRNAKLISLSTAVPVIVSFVLFLTDIINKTEFIPIRFYRDRTVIRFLSAFPLGFYLAKTVMAAFLYIFNLGNPSAAPNIPETILALLGSCGISFLIIFSRKPLIMTPFGFLISAGSLGFLIILYSILIKCAALIHGHSPDLKTCLPAAVIPAFLQICLLGGLHLYLIRFDQLIS